MIIYNYVKMHNNGWMNPPPTIGEIEQCKVQLDDYVQPCEDAEQQMDETRCIMEYKYIYIN